MMSKEGEVGKNVGQSLVQQYNQEMSLDQIRKLRLLKDLQRSPRESPQKHEGKRRMLTTVSMTQNLRKLNKNKKYMLEEERNTEIERNNRMLYQKIMGHFQSLKQTQTQCRNKWRKRRRKVQMSHQEESVNSSKVKIPEPIQFRSRVQTIRDNKVEQVHTLFLGKAQIDGIVLKIKLSLSKEKYLLLANNQELSIELQMEHNEYMRIHNTVLGGNPCNIFKFLEIQQNTVRFRQRGNHLKVSKTKTIV